MEKYSVKKKNLKEMNMTKNWLMQKTDIENNYLQQYFDQKAFEYLFSEDSRVYKLNKKDKRSILKTYELLTEILNNLIDSYIAETTFENLQKVFECKEVIEKFVSDNVDKVFANTQNVAGTEISKDTEIQK